MTPELITLSDTTATTIQYALVGTAATAFTELTKGLFKDWSAHKSILAFLCGMYGGMFQGLFFGFTQEFIIEGFFIGLVASGYYRVRNKKTGPLQTLSNSQTNEAPAKIRAKS